MNLLRVILATAIIFGTGVATGYLVATEQLFVAQPDPHTRNGGEQDSHVPLDHMRESMMDRMQAALELSEKQRKKIEEVFARSEERSKTLWNEMRVPLQQEVDRVQEEVKAILTPEQVEKFEKLNKKFKKNREKAGTDLLTDPSAHCSLNPFPVCALPL